MSPEMHAAISHLAHDLASQGRLIEAGFASLRIVSIPEAATAAELYNMRMAFLAGALHLYVGLTLRSDVEPTPADAQRLAMIAAEIAGFQDEVSLWITAPQGNA